MKNFGGVLYQSEGIIDRHLLGSSDGTPRFRHKRVALDLAKPPQGFQAQAMLKELVEHIRSNLEVPTRKGQSRKNWREDPQPHLSPKNKSKETRLERNIIKASIRAGRKDWWNQMPIASGLAGEDADRRRAIDLVHRLDVQEKHYEFVELKVDVGSGTPLFALMEIVLYGLVYLVLRKDRGCLAEISKEAKVFSAQEIGLRVLAPKDYFKDCALGWLESELSHALPLVLEEEGFGGLLTMDVSSHWPNTLEKWEDNILENDSRLLSYLEDWRPAFPQ